jgi:hypothetical protein
VPAIRHCLQLLPSDIITTIAACHHCRRKCH